MRLAPDLQHRRFTIRLNSEAKRQGQHSAAFNEIIVRAFERAFEIHVDLAQQNPTSTFSLHGFGARTEKRKAALRAAKVRRTHRGKKPSVEIFRRKGNGHAENRARYRMLAQNLPE